MCCEIVVLFLRKMKIILRVILDKGLGSFELFKFCY